MKTAYSLLLVALLSSFQAQAQTTKSRLVAGVSWASWMPCPDSVRYFYLPGMGGDLETKSFLPFRQLVDYQCDLPSGSQWQYALGGRSFDGKGRISSDTIWRANSPNEPLEPDHRLVFGYALDGLADTLTKFLWQNGSWKPTDRTTKFRSPTGKISQELNETWAAPGGWGFESRTVFGYNAADSLVLRRSEQWWNGSWATESLTEWKFDAQNRLIGKSSAFGGTTQKNIFGYDPEGYKILEINLHSGFSGTSSDTTVFQFTPAHDSVTSLKTNDWGLVERFRQRFSATGRTIQEWHDVAINNDLLPDYQRFKMYNAAGLVAIDSFLGWDGAAYRPSGVHHFEYTADGKTLLQSYYLFENSSPKKEQKWEYAYNAHGQLTTDKYFVGQGNAWFLEDWHRYYYETYEPVAAHQPLAVRPITLSPNPVFEQIWMPNEAGFEGLAQIFSADGRLVWSAQVRSAASIEVAHLPSGLYIFSMQTEACQYIGRFLKM